MLPELLSGRCESRRAGPTPQIGPVGKSAADRARGTDGDQRHRRRSTSSTRRAGASAFKPPVVEETRLLAAIKPGTTGSDLRRDFPRTVRIAGRSAWLFLVVTALNFLGCGFNFPQADWGSFLNLKRTDYDGTTRQYITTALQEMASDDILGTMGDYLQGYANLLA